MDSSQAPESLIKIIRCQLKSAAAGNMNLIVLLHVVSVKVCIVKSVQLIQWT